MSAPKTPVAGVALNSTGLLPKINQADARTRTGDPFITSDEPMSAPVRSGQLRPLLMPLPPDWSGLELTGEDNLVDGWWTCRMLTE